jgi:hypothetical protein
MLIPYLLKKLVTSLSLFSAEAPPSITFTKFPDFIILLFMFPSFFLNRAKLLQLSLLPTFFLKICTTIFHQRIWQYFSQKKFVTDGQFPFIFSASLHTVLFQSSEMFPSNFYIIQKNSISTFLLLFFSCHNG